MMRFFGQHEFTGARQRLESRLSQSRELILAVTIRKHRESEKVQPVVARLIECFEDARFVRIAAAPLQQRISLIAAVAAKISVQQINHGPEMPALFDVYLKKIAQVVKRRTSVAELSLLLD